MLVVPDSKTVAGSGIIFFYIGGKLAKLISVLKKYLFLHVGLLKLPCTKSSAISIEKSYGLSLQSPQRCSCTSFGYGLNNDVLFTLLCILPLGAIRRCLIVKKLFVY